MELVPDRPADPWAIALTLRSGVVVKGDPVEIARISAGIDAAYAARVPPVSAGILRVHLYGATVIEALRARAVLEGAASVDVLVGDWILDRLDAGITTAAGDYALSAIVPPVDELAARRRR